MVAVVCGGPSAEAEVSRVSGKCVAEALRAPYANVSLMELQEFGGGGLGAPLAGALTGELGTYLVFSGIALAAAGMGVILCWLDRNAVQSNTA